LKATIEDYRKQLKEKEKEISGLNNQLSKQALSGSDAERAIGRLQDEMLDLKK